MDEEDLIGLVIMERMSWHYRQFRREYPDEGMEAANKSDALSLYEQLASTLPPEDYQTMNDCLDHITSLISGDNERYYRAGIKDGIRIDQLIKQVKATQE